ncbi:MAG: ferredoxin-type protein NapG [Betaproteobacteria bacterium]|nr:ferredoxin-type protein NapG [Betaproteobacteria bacterium]
MAASRRQFLARSAQGAAGAACAGLAWFSLLRQEAHAAPFALRPPGARPAGDFEALCVKCGQCVRACPYPTLKLAPAAAGIPLGTPYFVPREEPCHLCEDIPCAKACPTGALDKALDRVDRARMGLAVVDAENCLSWQGLRCEVCYRVCPVKGRAITVDPHPRGISKHAVFVPVVHAQDCTGCGLCEKACPTQVAAIRVVDPRLVQGRIGEHFRRPATTRDAGLAEASPESAPAAPTAAPMKPSAAPSSLPGPQAPTGKAVDYLNAPVEGL